MFKRCSCGCYTDDDAERCSSCGRNLSEGNTIPQQELVHLIKTGEISLEKVWTKKPTLIQNALKAPL